VHTALYDGAELRQTCAIFVLQSSFPRLLFSLPVRYLFGANLVMKITFFYHCLRFPICFFRNPWWGGELFVFPSCVTDPGHHFKHLQIWPFSLQLNPFFLGFKDAFFFWSSQ
jgi:hypothetical protein